MNRLLTLIGFTFCLNASAFDSSEFRFRKELKGVTDGESLARFDLDPEVFRNTTDRFSDLRLVKVSGDSGIEIPHLVSRVDRYVPPESAKLIQSEVVSFGENPDGSVEFEVSLSERNERCATIDFRTPLRDFEKSVSVQGSVDGTDWEALISEALIFDRERFLDFRKTRLELPENEARFLRIRIADATDEQRSLVREISRTVGERNGASVTETGSVATRAFRIDSLRFLTEERDALEAEDERTYSAKIIEVLEDSETLCSNIVLETGRAPLTEFEFLSSDRNFRREVRIQVPIGPSRDSWRTIKRGRIFRYHIGDFQEENLSINFDSLRSDRFRIQIENGDSPPLKIDKVVATGDIHEVLFLSEPEAEWAIYYGSTNETLASPKYDTAALVLAKGRGIAAERFTPGEERENPGFQSNFVRPGWSEQKWALWLVITLLVGGLILILIKAGRGIEELE